MLGLDLGARFLRGAICDLGGRVRARQDVELAEGGAAAALGAIEELCAGLVEATGLERRLVDGVLAGVPGVVEGTNGVVRLAENVPGLEGMPFADELRERLDLPVVLENDINLAAVGERWRGAARGVDDFVFLSVGTGMGAGLVLGGELHRGRNGAAGEIDFARGDDGEASDPSAPAVSALAAELAEKDGETSLTPPYDARAVFGAARTGDALARSGRRRVREKDRAAHRPDRRGRGRRARRPRRRPRRERRPPPRARPQPAGRMAPVPTARRGLDPGRRRGADRRARRGAQVRPRQRLREAPRVVRRGTRGAAGRAGMTRGRSGARRPPTSSRSPAGRRGQSERGSPRRC